MSSITVSAAAPDCASSLKSTINGTSKRFKNGKHNAAFPDQIHKIRLGLCCMDKKLKSDHHKNVISRIRAYGDIEIVNFGDQVLLHQPIEEWPRCDVMAAYFSTGYPTERVQSYVDKYRPCLINDLKSQKLLRNRLSIKQKLLEHNIPTPKWALLDRNNPTHKVLEYNEKVIVNGITINKPFVEKPIDAENHNVYLYYKGGGSRRLFRKIGNRSSEPSDCSCIRRTGSFLYEECIESENDIKVYTVDDYVFAEIRKAPTVDGVVERDVFGKEHRSKCRLTNYEKQIAQQIVCAFDQKVCGFDIVRNRDGSPFVIDVNGWSFVKNNRIYWDHCARTLRDMCLEFDRTVLSPARYQKYDQLEEIHDDYVVNIVQKSNLFIDTQKMHILRGLFGIFRHGGRTPKQKYKCSTHNAQIVALVQNEKKFKLKWTYLNDAERISEFAKTATVLFNETQKNKWLRMAEILSLNLMSIKVQFKATEFDEDGKPTLVLCILKWGGVLTPGGFAQCQQFAPKFRDRLLQTSPENQQKFLYKMKVYMTEEMRVRKTAKEFTRILLNKPNEQLVEIEQYLVEGKKVQKMLDDISSVKGLVNTAKDEIQNIFYDAALRESLLDKHYLPVTPPKSAANLHANDETHLSVPEEPGLIGLGSASANSSMHLLLGSINSDHVSKLEKDLEQLKEAQLDYLQQDYTLSRGTSYDNDATQNDMNQHVHIEEVEPPPALDEKELIDMEFEEELNKPHSPKKDSPEKPLENGHSNEVLTESKEVVFTPRLLPAYKLLPWAQRLMKQIADPIKKCDQLYAILLQLQRVLEENLNSNKQPYLDESPKSMKQRWDKIIEELYDKTTKRYDCSKLPDVFDSCRYDLLYNRHILRNLDLSRLWDLIELLALFVMPQQYGLSRHMKWQIGREICRPLFQDIAQNIKQNCLDNDDKFTSRTFLYFTSESYLHSLRNALILSDIPANKYVAADIEGMECSYFSHSVIRLFEDLDCDKNSENRFYVDVAFSPGAYANPLIDVDKQVVSVIGCGPLNGRFPLHKFLSFLSENYQYGF